MLSKLIKHEWKATWKLPAGICIFEIIMTAIGCMMFRAPMWQSISSGRVYDRLYPSDVISMITFFTYMITLICATFAITIYFACRFYKNLYTDEGYLTHTLPVTPRQLIISKMLISTIWSFIVSILTVLSTLVMMGSFIVSLGVNSHELMDAFRELGWTAQAANDIFIQYSGGISPVLFLLIMIISFIVGSFSCNLIIYVCISIGQLVKKHKVAAAIIAYLVYSGIVSIVSSIASVPFMFNFMKLEYVDPYSPLEMAIAPFATMVPLLTAMLVVSIIFTAISYIGTEYIMKKKLNLD